MTTRRDDHLPLLHKYVIDPHDDLQLVLTKLNYRLCVKEVSKVIYRRSLGDSISEAIEFLEILPNITMNGNHHDIEQLMLSGEGPQCVSSPKILSPDDSYNCGTMKSDDSGIVMDDSHMNFSGDHSDSMFSSAEVSPIEEDNHILNGVNKIVHLEQIREKSVSPPGVYEEQLKPKEKYSTHNTDQQVAEFFKTHEKDEETIEDEEDVIVPSSDVHDTEPIEVHKTEPLFDEISEPDEISHSDIEDKVCETFEREEVEEEQERVDFVKGIRCDDVNTAIEILKTRYRLSDTTVRKFIITFSKWDVSQISHPISNRCSWWDNSQHYPQQNEEIEDLTEDIYTRQGEISDLVDRIMDEEKLKHDFAVQLAKQAEIERQQEEVIEKPSEAITIESVPPPREEEEAEQEDENIPNKPEEKPSNNKDSQNKKKNRNALQRFIHAISKRLRRNRPPGEKDRAKA